MATAGNSTTTEHQGEIMNTEQRQNREDNKEHSDRDAIETT
jgi:hypothetical protein